MPDAPTRLTELAASINPHQILAGDPDALATFEQLVAEAQITDLDDRSRDDLVQQALPGTPAITGGAR